MVWPDRKGCCNQIGNVLFITADKLCFNGSGIDNEDTTEAKANESSGTVLTHMMQARMDNGHTLQNRKVGLKVHKIKNFFGSDFEFCTISLLVLLKY